MRSLGRRTLTLIGMALFLTLGSIGGALAYWTGPGSGSGSTATAVTESLQLTPGTPTAGLYPGGQSDVTLAVANPNAATVRLVSLALDTSQGSGGFAVDASHSGCGLTTLSFTTSDNGGSGWTISGGATISVTLTGALAMSSAAANACQGATFTVYLKAGP